MILYTLQQQLDPILIGDLGAMNLGFERQFLRIHQEMALSVAYLLTSVIASRFATDSGGLGRLRVHHPRVGLGVPL